MQYRKKPVVVEALQFFPVPAIIKTDDDGRQYVATPEILPAGVVKIPAMTVDARERRGITYDMPARYVVNTLEGQMQINPGDWLVTGVKGKKYPCRPDIFDLSYEPADSITPAFIARIRAFKTKTGCSLYDAKCAVQKGHDINMPLLLRIKFIIRKLRK